MKVLIIYIILFLPLGLAAQDYWQTLKLEKVPEKYKTHSILYRLGKYREMGATDVMEKVKQQNIVCRSDSEIYAEIISGDDLTVPIDTMILRALNLRIRNVWKNRASCWMELKDILYVAEYLPEDYLLSPVRFPIENNEGPSVLNSDSYIANGADGTGIHIAIIDMGFDLYTEAQSGGHVPICPGYDWTGTGLESVTVHGTACLETVFDHAPGASYEIHKVTSATDFGSAIEWAILANTDIISHSISWPNTGWNDNSGPICSAVEDAANEGILFFTSAGNSNGDHWEGPFEDDNGDDEHEWSGSDDKNDFNVNPGETVQLNLQWDNSPLWDNYNLFLYNAGTGELLESSVNNSTFEELVWQNNEAYYIPVYVKVRHADWGTPDFELFQLGTALDELEYSSLSGSTACPSNSTEGNCISVGAVDKTIYPNFPSGPYNMIEDYSSLGPTNDGNQAPDIVGPTNTTTFAYSGPFSGTSCATPNAAGAAAAFWSGNSYLSSKGVRDVLFRKASLYHDWGPAGIDITYGYGGVRLYDYSYPTRYVNQLSGNITGWPNLPYYFIEDANEDAPPNSLIVILGGTFDANPGYIYQNPLTFVSVVEDAVIK